MKGDGSSTPCTVNPAMMTNQRGIFGLSTLPLVIGGAVILAVLGSLGVQQLRYNRLKQQLDVVTLQRDQVAGERDKAIGVAKQNDAVITQLKVEKEQINQALNQLEASRASAETGRSSREVIIQQQAGSSSSRAVTPPVIGDTITAIQADRAKRRPVP